MFGHAYAYDYVLPESVSKFPLMFSPIKDFVQNYHFNVDTYEIIPCIIENSIRNSLGEFIRQSYRAIRATNEYKVDYRSNLNYSSFDYFLLLHL